ncbi:MAG: glycogen debranching enzyme family protein [Fimbriimonadaceae bacterium]|nr:glycogen debranching enzyme family protein [Fimbriimonadaceae bacterium]QYK55340.1 MAG: glycogen debranching enzyme family protein [Fimbriimonadaceae bacterium]
MAYRLEGARCRDFSQSSRTEWLLTNGLGGYAMGTVSGANSRRYHGHLVAAIRPPTERIVLLAAIEAYATIADQVFGVSTNQYVGAVHPQGYSLLESFEVGDHAEWRFRLAGQALAKRLKPHDGANAVTVEYRNHGDTPIQLTLRPLACHKFYHDNFRVTDFYPQFLIFPEDRTILAQDGVQLFLEHPNAERTPTTGWYYRFEHGREIDRGLDPIDDLYCPCELRYYLMPGEAATLVASTEEGTPPVAFGELAATPQEPEAKLVEAAKYFLVGGSARTTIIAGYPWFTDWGRDTMISLPGICLETGNVAAAREILRAYAGAMNKGLVPNRFPDRSETPEYNTADATLWFANALHLTLQAEWDEGFALEAFTWLREIFEWHQKGTSFGIGVDPADGLLRQGADGYQLTWMDAKVGHWVVTPRHGKPIEVNGLWVNALRVAQALADRLGKDGADFRAAAELAEANFEAKFWKASMGHYLDTIDPDDASLRPNQLIAMGLPFAPLRGENAKAALRKIREELLTEHGLRTLGPRESAYRGKYIGTMTERDAAYHQGTTWPWLIGPYVSAVLRVEGDVAEARRVLTSVPTWMDEYGLGGIAEVYDGDEPQNPGGCPWQAWSTAEALRAWRETEAFAKGRE